MEKGKLNKKRMRIFINLEKECQGPEANPRQKKIEMKITIQEKDHKKREEPLAQEAILDQDDVKLDLELGQDPKSEGLFLHLEVNDIAQEVGLNLENVGQNQEVILHQENIGLTPDQKKDQVLEIELLQPEDGLLQEAEKH